MIDQYYQLIYLITVTIVTIPYYVKYENAHYKVVRDNSRPILVLSLILMFFIGMRPTNSEYFGDTIGYAGYYTELSTHAFTWEVKMGGNLIFDNLMSFMASSGFCYTLFLLIYSSIYFGARYSALKKMFPNNIGVAYVMFLASFITYSSAINGYKAGVAASLFCCAIAYNDDFPQKWWRPLIFLALSYGFHHSMHVCIVSYIVCKLYRKSGVYYTFWLFCLGCAILHITTFQNLFAQFTDESVARYLLS